MNEKEIAEKEMEEDFKKHRFRPPMDTAENPEHEEHIKKIREQHKNR